MRTVLGFIFLVIINIQTYAFNTSLKGHFMQGSNNILLKEDFSRFVDGSEDKPDGSNIADAYSNKLPVDLTSIPGWEGGGVHQAGGFCFITDYEMYGKYDGYLQTPILSFGAGAVEISFRARLSGLNTGKLKIYLSSNQDSNQFLQVGEVDLSSQWKLYKFNFNISKDEYKNASIKFSGENGKYLSFYIDDVVVQKIDDSIPIQDQSVVTLHTDLPYGTSITLYPKTKSYDIPIAIDFGDGQKVTKNIDPNSSGYFARFDGTVKGTEIKIYAPLTHLEAEELGITQISCDGQSDLTFLSLKMNKITNDNLDLTGAPNLEYLDLSYNQMGSYNFRSFTKLKTLNLSHNESLGNVLVTDGGPLESIDLSFCDVSVFYPVNLPNLQSINFQHNSLMNIEIGENYPNLQSLNLTGNSLTSFDISKCKKLMQLACDSNQLESLDVSFNPELTQLNCSVNKLTALNISNNTKLTTISCEKNNGIKSLDISRLTMLTQLSCDENQIDFLDFSNCKFLRRLSCRKNLISFLDFDSNSSNLDYVDIRDNANMTACAINFMFMTLPGRSRRSYSSNLLISGCPGADKSNPELIHYSDYDKRWKPDVMGDGSVKCEKVAVTLKNSENGSYQLTQSTNEYGQAYQPVTAEAYIGRVIRAETHPNEGFDFKGFKINGKLFPHDQFIITEPNSTIEPVFEAPSYLKLKAIVGQDLSIAFAGVEDNTSISIDWGDGVKVPYTIKANSLTRIEHKAVGADIRIEGRLKKLVLDSYPGTGSFDNNLQGVAISNQPDLQSLEMFMNPGIKTIDLSGCPNLKVLNCDYCGLKDLNVKYLTLLDTLQCGGNELTTLDVSALTNLKYLGAKINKLQQIDLSHNTKLMVLDLTTNDLESIQGLEKLTALRTLKLGFNKLREINLSSVPDLIGLLLSHNQLQSLDLSGNTNLVTLYFDQNMIKQIDLSKNTQLGYVNCADNGMTACDLNDLYYNLPTWTDIPGLQLPSTLVVDQANGENPNQSAHADSKIATLKGWKINQDGDGSGCDKAYISILPISNGVIRIMNAGTEVHSGDIVAVSSALSFDARPSNGFKLSWLKANGKVVDAKKSFTIKGYTVFQALFEQGKSALTIDASKYIHIKGNQLIIDRATTSVCVYDVSGKMIKSLGIQGNYRITLRPGIYVVTINENASSRKTFKLIIGK